MNKKINNLEDLRKSIEDRGDFYDLKIGDFKPILYQFRSISNEKWTFGTHVGEMVSVNYGYRAPKLTVEDVYLYLKFTEII